MTPTARNKRTPAIGVFDSGVGGLSILAAIKARIPDASFVYAADNAHFPYGTRTQADIINLTTSTVAAMLALTPVDVVVIACNTASTAALDALRQTFAVPFVGVVPAVKPAAAQTHSGVIGLLATPTTVAGAYTSELIGKHAQHVRVLKVGSRRLVELAEMKLRGTSVSINEVRAEIAPLFNQTEAQPAGAGGQVDTVVLGCTHFPLLLPELTAAAPWPVNWIDSGAAVADRTAAVLESAVSGERQSSAVVAENRCYFTSTADTSILQPALRSYGFDAVELLRIPPTST